MNNDDEELLIEIPKIVQISYLETMLTELLEHQQEAQQELNNYKEYTNKKLTLLEERLFKVTNIIKNTSEALEKLKEIEGLKPVRGNEN